MQTRISNIKEKMSSSIKIDPYSVVIIEDLLQGTHQWRNIQDIIRLSFQALTDVVKVQGQALSDIENQLLTRVILTFTQVYFTQASKTELNTGLSLKANVADVSHTIQQVAENLDNKLSFEDASILMKDYVLKTDFEYMISDKVNLEELKRILDTKTDLATFKQENLKLAECLSDMSDDFTKKFNSTALQRDLEFIQQKLGQKADERSIINILDTKANKETVKNALLRKVNKSDIDAILVRKADIVDIQELVQVIEKKVDIDHMEQFVEILETKAEQGNLEILSEQINNNPSQIDMEKAFNKIQQIQQELENLTVEKNKNINMIQRDFDNFKYGIQTEMNAKASQKEMEVLSTIINKKADFDQLQHQISNYKLELNDEISAVKNEVQFNRTEFGQASKKTFETNNLQFGKQEQKIHQLNKEIQLLNSERNNDMRETINFIKKMVKDQKLEVEDQMSKIMKDTAFIKAHFGPDGLTDMRNFKKEVRQSLVEKVDLAEVQNAINICQEDVARRILKQKQNTKAMLSNQLIEILDTVSNKADRVEVQQLREDKVDMAYVERINEILKNKVDLETIKVQQGTLEKLSEHLENAVNVNDFENHIVAMKEILQEVQKEVLSKANIKDISLLIEEKASNPIHFKEQYLQGINEVNKELQKIHIELDEKVQKQKLKKILKSQTNLNNLLCSENIVGRWKWNSGKTDQYLVPWESQSINTLPDNFLWEEDSTQIIAVSQGFYEISFGFFSQFPVDVQLLINGDPISIKQNKNKMIKSGGKSKRKTYPSSKRVIGVTFSDFVLLAERSRLSISVGQNGKSEGFFQLRRV